MVFLSSMGIRDAKSGEHFSRSRRRLLLSLAVVFFTQSFLNVLGSGQDDVQELRERTGSLEGRVLERDARSPLPEALVRIVALSVEVTTDSQGRFFFASVPVGGYVLEASRPYFRTRRIPDVIVKSERITSVDIELEAAPAVEAEVTVAATYFPGRAAAEAGTSFSGEEIRRAAGSAGDISRLITVLPSVARTQDMRNDLVVRGGAPAENGFYIDNIEVPNINHYPALGSTAGAIGLLNVDFIRDVEFFSGGFSPVYGNRLSSVMDIGFREGNRREHDFRLSLDMMGLGLAAEGPLAGGDGSWMISARRSYIDLLIGLMGQGVPVSWSDVQGKAVLDLSPSNKLTFLGLLGVDDSGTDKDDALKDAESHFGRLDTREQVFGINWFSMWGGRGYSNTSLSLSSTRFRQEFYETVSEAPVRRGNVKEQILSLRNVNSLNIGPKLRLRFGFEAKKLRNGYDDFLAPALDALGNWGPGFSHDVRLSSSSTAVFGRFAWTPAPPLTMHLGLRVDHFALNKSTDVQPRIGAALTVSKKLSLELAAGMFSQHLPLVLLVREDDPALLRNPRARHFIFGMKYLLDENTRLVLEAYDKTYRGFPLDPGQPQLFVFDEVYQNGYFGEHAVLLDSGRARSRGVELMIQKKLAEKVYGIASVSWFRARYRGLDGPWYDRVYDNRFVLAVEGGYKSGKHWEFGLKWNSAGGVPFTPFDEEASRAANSGILDPGRIHAERLPPYHALNLRADRRFHFRSANLTLYLSLWNVFNRKNVFAVYWNTIEQRPGRISGWGLLPVFGVEFDF